jgi:hypothetical protein
MNVIKFLIKFTVLTITLMGMSSISYAHSDSSKIQVKYQSKIQIRPIIRVQSKLLPKALYVQTMGHTFKRRFAFQNQPIKQVYYDRSQPTHKLYASLISQNHLTKPASSYWP